MQRQKDIGNQDTGLHELFLKDSNTRLRRTKFSDRNKRKTPFGFDELPNEQLTFRQLKTKGLLDNEQLIYEEHTDKNYKSKIKFHSIESIESYEKSRNTKLDTFLGGFVSYIQKIGFKADFKRLKVEQIKTKPDADLIFENFEINVIDKRFNKKVDIQNIIECLNNTYKHIFKDNQPESKVKFVCRETEAEDNILILMDYSKNDFDYEYLNHRKEQDGYPEVKREFSNSQGFCINPNSFLSTKDYLTEHDFLNYTSFEKMKLKENDKEVEKEIIVNKDLRRNFGISIQQLYLKSLITKPILIADKLPHYEILKDLGFIYCFSKDTVENGREVRKRFPYLCYTENGQLRFENLKSEKAREILETRFDVDLLSISEKRKEYDVYLKDKDGLINGSGDVFLILSKNFLWEVKELPERVLYPDIKEVLFNREFELSKEFFMFSEKAQLFFTVEQIEKYNKFITDKVADHTSYEKLVGTKKGKHRNEIFEILGLLKRNKNGKLAGTEERFTKCLCAIGNIDIKGKKAGDSFATYSGIWFDRENLQYFVGSKEHGYKYKQSTGYQMRKIILYKGAFDENIFFPLLNVDFVKYKSYSVQPFVFNLMKMYLETDISVIA